MDINDTNVCHVFKAEMVKSLCKLQIEDRRHHGFLEGVALLHLPLAVRALAEVRNEAA